MSEVLKVEHISKSFAGLKALSGVSFSMQDNEIFGVIGPNGAGKTTLFNIVTGFDNPNEGSVFLFGEEMTGRSTTDFCLKGVARTFQNIRVFNNMTVLQNTMVGMHRNMQSNLLDVFFKTKRQKNEERAVVDKAMELLVFLGISNDAHVIAKNLPYGKLRKLEIARALASDPKLVLLDEPTAGMNPQETEDLMELVAKIRDMGPAVIVIEHNVKFMMNLSHRIAVLNFGKLIAVDTPEHIQTNREVVEAYLGKDDDATENAS